MNQNGITFYVLTAEQYNWFKDFCMENSYAVPEFTLYEDGNYYLQSGGSADFLLAEFDDECNPDQMDYSTKFWTLSTVPSVLWP